MKRYAVAILRDTDSYNTVEIVEAESKTDAIIEAVIASDKSENPNYDTGNEALTREWLNKHENVEDMIEVLFDQNDLYVSEPVEI